MAVYTEADVIASPPTLDDVDRYLNTGNYYCSPQVAKALQTILRFRGLQAFNFGQLALETVREAQTDAISFVQNKCFTLPYEVCIYRGCISYDNANIGNLLMIFQIDRRPGPFVDNINGIGVIRIIHTGTGMFAMECVCTDVVKDTPEGLAIQMYVPPNELEYWEEYLKSREEITWQMTEGALSMLGMTMILNTKGVYKERMEPPIKPNKARLAAGRPLLPYTTKVYTHVYNQAAAPGTGTHASPRPHRRRAHVRHTEGRVIPVMACLVNWDGAPLEARKEYKID